MEVSGSSTVCKCGVQFSPTATDGSVSAISTQVAYSTIPSVVSYATAAPLVPSSSPTVNPPSSGGLSGAKLSSAIAIPIAVFLLGLMYFIYVTRFAANTKTAEDAESAKDVLEDKPIDVASLEVAVIPESVELVDDADYQTQLVNVVEQYSAIEAGMANDAVELKSKKAVIIAPEMVEMETAL